MHRGARAGLLIALAAAAAVSIACESILNVDGIELSVAPSLPPPPPAPEGCQEGEAACVGVALQLCRPATHTFSTARICSSAALCCAGGACGEVGCQRPACSPGDYRCQGNALQMCNEGQTDWTEVDRCPSAAQCDASLGRCTAQPCVAAPSTLQCDGNAVVRCTGSDWQPVSTCATPTLCDKTTTPASCAVGGCQRNPTTSSEVSPFRCENGDLQRCNDSETGFEHVETCLNPTSCNALYEVKGDPHVPYLEARDLQNLGCNPPACTPGTFECRGAALYRCNRNRTGYLGNPVAVCASPGQCNASEGRCKEAPCSNDERQCSGSNLQRCQDGAWTTEKACASAAECTPLGCKPTVCEPMAYHCAGASLERCSATGASWLPEHTCETTALCNEAAKRCDSPVCQPGQQRCNAQGQLEGCSPGREGWALLADCPTLAGTVPAANATSPSGLCDAVAGRCLPAPSCAAASLRCNGQYLERCADNAWHPQSRCLTPTLCDAVNGVCRAPLCEPGTYQCARLGTLLPAGRDDSLLGLPLQVCDPSGERFVPALNCGENQWCDPIHGQCDICDASDPAVCIDSVIYLCTADGQERTLDRVCSQGCEVVSSDAGAPKLDRPTCRGEAPD